MKNFRPIRKSFVLYEHQIANLKKVKKQTGWSYSRTMREALDSFLKEPNHDGALQN